MFVGNDEHGTGRGVNVKRVASGVRHGGTIAVLSEFDTYIDTDNFERVVGIEILAPGSLGLN